MKIALVAPPNTYRLTGNNPTIIDDERGKNPPLGLLYLAADITRDGRHKVTVVDCEAEEYDHDRLRQYFARENFDALGVTVTTFTLLDAMEVVTNYRKSNPSGTVIVGGPHVAIFYNEILRSDSVDIAVKKEGEPVINRILDALSAGTGLGEIPGILFKQKGEVVDTGDAEVVQDLDSLAIPDRSLLPYRSYYSLLGSESYSTTLFTSRGCPFKCAFCDRPALGKAFRSHSADYVIKEIQHGVDLGIHEFLIYDDTFTVSRSRVVEICRQLMERKLKISFDIRARVDTVDEDLLVLLKQAGCQAVHYGVEAGSDRILKRLNKGITIDKVKKAFKATRRAGMNTLAYFMVGSPGETREDVRQTLDLAKELAPDYVHLTIFTPFPATRLYREGLLEGIIATDVWQAYAEKPARDFMPPVWGEVFSREDLNGIIKDFYRSFYLRPTYVFKRLGKIRSAAELRRHVKAGLSVLKMGLSRKKH